MTSDFAALGLLALTGAVVVACGASDDPEAPPGGPGKGGTGAAATGSDSTGAVPARAGAGTINDAGLVEPPSTLINPVEFTSSCELEACTADERCLDCTFGTCCGKSCGQQLPCPTGEVTFCDRQGGAIACAAP